MNLLITWSQPELLADNKLMDHAHVFHIHVNPFKITKRNGETLATPLWRDTYVVTNNHNLGKAFVNALEITSLLTGEIPEVPMELERHYPELKKLVAAQGS